MLHANPFALVRASDYTDEQINSLWVELGASTINAIIEPQSKISKYILGGKGTGKTHLLRYYSYQVAKLRFPRETGLAILAKQKFLAIFVRATGLDAARFEGNVGESNTWQQLFGIYIELRLGEGVLDALCDIKKTSPNEVFNDSAFIAEMGKSILDPSVSACQSISDFRAWIINERRKIDDAVNNAAFVGTLDLRIPFSIGSLCLPVSKAIGCWNKCLSLTPLIYLIDEIENLTESQQQVLNSLIRYGEGLATFRVTGRLYARKTLSTLADGEENREGAEFKTTYLDDILRGYGKYPEFAKKFVARRLRTVGVSAKPAKSSVVDFDPFSCFEEIDASNYYSAAIGRLNIDPVEPGFKKYFIDALKSSNVKDIASPNAAKEIADILTGGNIPLILQKLNFLRFCKKYKKSSSSLAIAKKIHTEAIEFLHHGQKGRSSYATAYGHWASDLFAQLWRESKKIDSVPYAGFDSFVKMSCGNPRNLLIILGRAYEIASFKEVDFINGPKLSVAMQTEAAIEAARFMYESDTNYGSQSESAREAVNRLAQVLRTARYAINIPEVSPLAISFYDGDLTSNARQTLNSALNYSFVFEIHEGRPDRNSERLNRKIQLTPLLSPRWGLPISRRGDLGLSRELINSIFDTARIKEFDFLLRFLSSKWNNPFATNMAFHYQEALPL
jgi:hypothetical protein